MTRLIVSQIVAVSQGRQFYSVCLLLKICNLLQWICVSFFLMRRRRCQKFPESIIKASVTRVQMNSSAKQPVVFCIFCDRNYSNRTFADNLKLLPLSFCHILEESRPHFSADLCVPSKIGFLLGHRGASSLRGGGSFPFKETTLNLSAWQWSASVAEAAFTQIKDLHPCKSVALLWDISCISIKVLFF